MGEERHPCGAAGPLDGYALRSRHRLLRASVTPGRVGESESTCTTTQNHCSGPSSPFRLFHVSSSSWGKVRARCRRTVPSCRSQFPIRWMQHLHHQARWQELKRSEWLVIPWAANARKIPTAVLGSVGPVYRQPIATIHDINFRFKKTQRSKATTKEALSAYQSPSLSASWFQRSGMHF